MYTHTTLWHISSTIYIDVSMHIFIYVCIYVNMYTHTSFARTLDYTVDLILDNEIRRFVYFGLLRSPQNFSLRGWSFSVLALLKWD